MSFSQIVIIISLISFLVVGLVVKRSSMKSYSEFTMKRGGLGWFTIACGISMTYAGGAAILTTASIGYSFKWYALIDPIALLIGLLITILLFNKYRDNKGTTISELLSFDNKAMNVLTGIVTSFTFILIVAAQFVALSKLLAPYFPSVNPLLITFFVSTGIFSYVFFGGFNSVTKTDILQYILITIFLVLPMLFFALFMADNQVAAGNTHSFVAMPIDYIILFSIPIVFTPLSQDINLRVKSAKNSRQGKLGLMIGGLFYLSITLAAAYVGVYMGKHGIALSDPEQAIPIFFKDAFPKLGFFAIIATLSAIVSSLDSYTLNSITSISNDIIRPLSTRNDNPPRNIKIAAIITYILAMAIALFFNKVLALSMTSLLVYISVLLPISMANILKLKGSQIFVMTIVEILFIVMVEVTKIELSPKAIVYPVFGCSISLVFWLINTLYHGNKTK